MRLRLSSSRQPYRRGGFKIGPKNAATVVSGTELGGMEAVSLLALLADPVITIAFGEVGDDEVEVWRVPCATERAEAVDGLKAAVAAGELADKDGLAELADELLGQELAGGGASGVAGAAQDAPIDPQAVPETPAPKIQPGGGSFSADRVENVESKPKPKPKAAAGRKPRPAKAARG